MPRLTKRQPSYRLHKASGQAVVSINGRTIYLGKYDSAESKTKYNRLVAEYLAADRCEAKRTGSKGASIITVCGHFARFAADYYTKNGKPTSELSSYKTVIRSLCRLYGDTPADDFGPLALRAVRETWLESGYARDTINRQQRRVVRIFRWAVEEELIEVETWQRLKAVTTLRKGRTRAPERERVKPVEPDRVAATLPHLSPVVAAMVRLQMLTGMRPGEVCQLRRVDIDTSIDVWEFRPASHKREHHELDRVIYIGPQAQDILRPYLLRDASAFCFSPAESIEHHREKASAARVTPANYGNARGRRRQSKDRHPSKRTRVPRDHWDASSYYKAIARACRKAWPAPDDIRDDATAAAEWDKRHRWAPNQLRHTHGTEVRRKYGLEAAQVILGHSNAKVTEVYAERDAEKARAVIAKIG